MIPVCDHFAQNGRLPAGGLTFADVSGPVVMPQAVAEQRTSR